MQAVRRLSQSTGRRMLRLMLSLSVCLSLLLVVLPAFAQSGQGAVTGVVTDGKSAVIRNADVTLVGDETGVQYKSKTDSAGAYAFRSLNPGTYTLTVKQTGFNTEVVRNLVVAAEQTATADLALKVGSANETVTVTEDTLQITTNTPDIATTIDHDIVQDLPYPERSSLEAALLAPGVTGDPSVPGGIFSENPVITTGPVVPGASISISGAPPGTSAILVDGSDIVEASYSRTGINLSNIVVRETTVITTGLSAKYGRTGGGVIVQATAAGTSNFHGRVTWRHTDPYFNAYPLASSAPNNLHENFYGFYLSGPVRVPGLYNGRDRTFFFAAGEPARIVNLQAFRGIFPTADEVAGRIHNNTQLLNQTILKGSGYAAAIAAPRVGATTKATACSAAGANANSPATYYNTTLNAQGFPNGPLSASAQQPICNGSTLQPDDLSAQLAQNGFAKYVFSLLPTPNNPGAFLTYDNAQGTYDLSGNNATYKRGVTDVDNRWSVRVDHSFGPHDQMFVRYVTTPVSGPRFFALAQDNPVNQVPVDVATSRDVAIGYTHIFSPSLVGIGHYSFLRANINRTPPVGALGQDYAAKYGLTPAAAGQGFPALGSLGGSTLQLANAAPYQDVDQNFIGGIDFDWVRGKHQLQFGFDLRWIQSDQYDSQFTYGGKYGFSQTLTSTSASGSGGSGGDTYSTFILGMIGTYSAAPVAVPGYYRWHYYAGYFQDDWRITPHFTMNLGLRYNLETPRMEKYNNQGTVVLLNSPVSFGTGGTTSAEFCFSGACGLSNTLWPTNYKGFEPRIGFGLEVTPRVSMRGGYALVHLPLTGYENIPDPDFNIAAQTVTYNSGAQNPAAVTDYVTNSVGPLTSAYTNLNGNHGPLLTAQGLNPVYVSQSNSVPYTQNYNLTVQWQATHNTLLNVSYQGLKGTHLIGGFAGAINVPSLATLQQHIASGDYLSYSAANQWGITNGFNTTALQETKLQTLNPYQNFFNQSIPEIYPRRGASQYHALYITTQEKIGRYFSAVATYTWSKSIDNVPDTNAGSLGNFGTTAPQDPTNSYIEKAVSSYDQPSRLRVGYNFNLPVGKNQQYDLHNGLLNAIVGNISTAGLITVASGYPNFAIFGPSISANNASVIGNFVSFTPGQTSGGTAGKCSAAVGSYCASAALPYGYVLRPNITPGKPLINPHWKDNPFGLNGGAFTPYLNPEAFGCSISGTSYTCAPSAAPGAINAPTLGNAPRTLTGARSPREFLFDARVKKGMKFHDRYTLNLTATFNNVFNHPVYFAANNTANDPLISSTSASSSQSITLNPAATTFGRLNSNSANLSRVIRIGAEFVF